VEPDGQSEPKSGHATPEKYTATKVTTITTTHATKIPIMRPAPILNYSKVFLKTLDIW
jgi:hypothetical protein